jgi:hypothetical protein
MKTVTLLLLFCSLAFSQNKAVLENLNDNSWVKLPATGEIPNDIRHTAIAVDHDKSRIYLYGSDTHSNRSNYNNTIWAYDVTSGTWSTLYAPDDSTAYGMDSQGHPITDSGRPVASHVFDGMDYFSSIHCMIVIQNPKHAGAQPFGGPYDDWVWPMRRPTLWLYDADANAWSLMKKRILTDLEIFINASACAHDEQAFYWQSHGRRRIYRFSLADSLWTEITNWQMGTEYHTVWAYDSHKKRILIRPGLGSKSLFAYYPQSDTWDTLGSNTFFANGIAMDFDDNNKALITVGCDPAYTSNYYSSDDPEGRSLTHIYDSEQEQWINPDPANRPNHWGFNFKGAYDPVLNVFFYLEYPKGTKRLDVWAYRYKKVPARIEENATQENQNLQMEISPNPFNSRTTIKVQGNGKRLISDLKIYDIHGKLVTSKSFYLLPFTFYLQAEGLSPGIYLAVLKAGRQQVVKKIYLSR